MTIHSSESFGVECARLAGLPESILENATKRSSSMETTVTARAKRNASFKAVELLKALQRHTVQSDTQATIEILRALVPVM
jgi:DNA mismatch repair protein MSH3